MKLHSQNQKQKSVNCTSLIITIPGLVEMELKFLHEQSWQNLKMGDKIVLAVIGKKQAFLTYRKN